MGGGSWPSYTVPGCHLCHQASLLRVLELSVSLGQMCHFSTQSLLQLTLASSSLPPLTVPRAIPGCCSVKVSSDHDNQGCRSWTWPHSAVTLNPFYRASHQLTVTLSRGLSEISLLYPHSQCLPHEQWTCLWTLVTHCR